MIDPIYYSVYYPNVYSNVLSRYYAEYTRGCLRSTAEGVGGVGVGVGANKMVFSFLYSLVDMLISHLY